MNIEIAIGVGSGVGGIALKWLYDYWRKRKRANPLHVERLIMALNHVVACTPASRALIAAAHNDGGIPKAGQLIKASVVNEIYAAPYTESVKADWQAVILDDNHLRLLMQAKHGVNVSEETENIKSERLKRYYKTHNVARNHIVWLANQPDRWLYLVCHEPFPLADWTEEQVDCLETEVNKLRKAVGP